MSSPSRRKKQKRKQRQKKRGNWQAATVDSFNDAFPSIGPLIGDWVYGLGIFHSLIMAHPKKPNSSENGWNVPGRVAGNDQRYVPNHMLPNTPPARAEGDKETKQ